MKTFFLLIFFFFASVVVAHNTQESCYSVQLKSFKLRHNSTYKFDADSYPQECRYLSFGSVKTIRCGCFERYNQAKKEQKKLHQHYPKSLIVKTYKFRFKKDESKANDLKQQTSIAQEVPIETKEEHNFDASNDVVEENFADSLTFRGDISFISQLYTKAPKFKNQQDFLLRGNLEGKYQKDALSGVMKLRAQADYYDTQESAKHTDTSYLRLDEFYMQYDFDEDMMLAGKNIRFWGALELRNVANVFNLDELRGDPFYTDKQGAYNISWTHYTESGEISAIVKLYEQDRAMAGVPYVYYYFPPTVSLSPTQQLPLKYSGKLQTSTSRYRPSVYLKYSGTTDTTYPVDFAFILQNGYDSQRYYTKTLMQESFFQADEHAYLVNKFITYDTVAVGATLYKFEGVYANIIDDALISDYAHIGAGLEHTFSSIYKQSDVGLLVEYYKYYRFDKAKKDDLELFEVFQNDLFLGLRYSFNDVSDSAVVGGGVFDLDYNEQVYYIQYDTRIFDTLKLNLDYRYIAPSQNYNTAFHLLGAHERFHLKLGYYF